MILSSRVYPIIYQLNLAISQNLYPFFFRFELINFHFFFHLKLINSYDFLLWKFTNVVSILCHLVSIEELIYCRHRENNI